MHHRPPPRPPLRHHQTQPGTNNSTSPTKLEIIRNIRANQNLWVLSWQPPLLHHDSLVNEITAKFWRNSKYTAC